MVNHIVFEREEAKTLLGKYQFQSACGKTGKRRLCSDKNGHGRSVGRGKSFQTEIDEEIIFEQLQRKKGAIWSLFLAGGYLKVVKSEFDISSGRYSYELALTNQESQNAF